MSGWINKGSASQGVHINFRGSTIVGGVSDVRTYNNCHVPVTLLSNSVSTGYCGVGYSPFIIYS